MMMKKGKKKKKKKDLTDCGRCLVYQVREEKKKRKKATARFNRMIATAIDRSVGRSEERGGYSELHRRRDGQSTEDMFILL